MKSRLKELLAKTLSAAGPTFRRFWVSIGLTFALTSILITITGRTHNWNSEFQTRLSLALFAGLLASWCTILFWETYTEENSNAFTANLVALGISGAITGGTYMLLDGLTFVSVSRHIGICIFLFLLFLTIPRMRKHNGLEMHIVALFTQAVISILFAAVLFIGLALITATITTLFSIWLPSQIYIQIWLVMVGIFAPFLFMAGIPKPGTTVSESAYPKTLYNLVIFVGAPLLTAYTGILYLYFAKILITRQWPVGLISHLVLWFSLAGIALLYFIWPIAKDNRWANTFSQYFTKTALPLLIMMFFSMGIRIKHYGFTENRYYVVILGLWLFGAMIYLSFAKTKISSTMLLISLAALTVLSVIGPVSSFSVSKWSQNQRLNQLCAKYGMLAGGHIVVPPSTEVAEPDQVEIAEIVRYFDDYHNLTDIGCLPEGFTFAQFEAIFGFTHERSDWRKPLQTFNYDATNQPVDIEEYQYLFDYTQPQYKSDDEILLTKDNTSTIYRRAEQSFKVTVNGKVEWEDTFPALVGRILEQHDSERVEFLPSEMVFEIISPGNHKIKLVITSLWGDVDGKTEKPYVHHAGFFLLVGKASE